MGIKTISVDEAQNDFRKCLDTAQREPVIVQDEGGLPYVILSIQDIEDMAWGEEARHARNKGFIGERQSADLIASLLNAQD